MKNKEQEFRSKWLGRDLIIKTGKLAKQADAAVTVQYGETVVMATVVEAKEERDTDFFPLMVDFEERLYAAGIIKGSRWIKREGRPTDEAILTARMIDRSIRPLFDDNSRKEVQVIITVLSVDQENDHDIVSLIAASAVLSISSAQWRGPIAGVRIGRINEKFIFNPTYEEQEKSDLDLIVAGKDEKVIMIEAGAKDVRDNNVYEAIKAGREKWQEALSLIKKMQSEINRPQKITFKPLKSEEEIKTEQEFEKSSQLAKKWLEENIKQELFNKERYTKGERKLAVKIIKEKLDNFLFKENVEKEQRSKIIKQLAEKMIEEEVTTAILAEEKRVDGRKLDEIRPLAAEVGILPRNHGAGLFSRGETQVMSIVTLGSPGLEQSLEGLEGTHTKRYMHHYNFPPYSVGETRPLRGVGRREIGHGALAEKALLPVIPAKEKFPYTIRVVSETLGSNGSSSMGATCASSLALMDAGVPIKKAVAGIAMGLASNNEMSKWKILTDIQDLEDGKGGMDFKITGTKDGLTAIQLDTKTEGLTDEIIKKTLEQGRKALNQVLDALNQAIDRPRAELSKYAPRIFSLRIDKEKIREVIGSGGKVINGIISDYDVSVDIDDDGLVVICGLDSEKCQQALSFIKNIVREFTAGEMFSGKVTRLMDFGAFVEITPGHEGMVHVSEIAPFHINKPEDILKIGDLVTVKIKEIDELGRINLTMKGLRENESIWKNHKNDNQQQQNNFHHKKFFRPKKNY